MKFAILLLAALAGLATASRPLLQQSYEYLYRGEVKSGIPELRNQYSGVALTANVRVTVRSSSSADVQILNPRVGSMNGIVTKNGRIPLPIPSMRPLKDRSALEQTFTIHFSGQSEKLQVPQGEMLWISNLRKTIVSMFRVPYVFSAPVESYVDVMENKIRSQTDIPRTMKKREETLHGKCVTTYTLTKAAPRSSLKLKELEQESSMSYSDSTYRLYRSVDFYDCEERIVLEKASHGNLTMAGSGQFRGVQSRSSVGEYLLTGEPTQELSMRIEEAIIEGSVTLNPFGHETHKLMTITNQTLSLIKSSSSAMVRPPVSSLKDETWAYRVESPYKRASDSPSWVSFMDKEDELFPIYPEKDLTGFGLTTQLREQLKSFIKTQLESIKEQVRRPNKLYSKQYGGSVDGQVVQKLESIVSRLRALPRSDIERLYTEVVERSDDTGKEQTIVRELFINALKASGAPAALKVLLQKIKEGKIVELEAASLFVTMNSNVVNPIIIPDLIDYAISLPESSSVSLKSSVLINLSSLIRRLCLSEENIQKTFRYPKEILGSSKCDRSSVHDRFIPFLTRQVTETSKTYLKTIYIQALANLGDKKALKTLTEIAEGVILRDEETLRLLAIRGITKNHIRNTSYPYAQEVLLAIAEDQVEKPILREAAVASLFTLPQNATFYQRMALSTWREPSTRVASFIYSIIRTVSNSRDPWFRANIAMARHALVQAKPQPVSPYYSAYLIVDSYDVRKDLSATIESMYLASTSSSIPESMMLKFVTELGGIKIPLAHISTYGKGLEYLINTLKEKIRSLPVTIHSRQDSNYKESVMEMEKITEGVSSMRDSEDARMLIAHLTVLKNVELFAPIDYETLKDLSNPTKSMIASVFEKLRNGKAIQGLSYYNPVDITEVLPSDIGLPIVTQISRPTFLYTEIDSNYTVEPESLSSIGSVRDMTYFNVTGHTISKVVLKKESSMKVLVPWNNETVVVGIDGETTVSLPMNFFVAMDKRSSFLDIFQAGVIHDDISGTIPTVITRNLPFTLVRPLFPTSDVTEENIKPIHIDGDHPAHEAEVVVPKGQTGFDSKIYFEGDVQYPINMTTVTETLVDPLRLIELLVGPTSRYYQMALMYSPRGSETKEITTTLTYANLSPSSQSSPDELPLIENLSAKDTIHERIQKLRRYEVPVSSMVAASLNLTGPQVTPTKYEMVVINFPWKSTTESEVKFQQRPFQINFMRTSPRTSPSETEVCFSNSIKYPDVEMKTSILDLLSQSDLNSRLRSNIYTEGRCSRSNVNVYLQAFTRISSLRSDYIKRIISTEKTEMPYNPTEAVKSTLVYDRIDAEAHVMKPLSPFMQNVTQFAVKMAHGLMFPQFEHNRINVQETPNLYILNGTRSLSTDRYTMWVHSPSMICLVRDLRVPYTMDYYSPLNRYASKPVRRISDSMEMESHVSNMCVIDRSRVNTFAGSRYDKESIPCEQVAMLVNDSESEKFAILTKELTESPDSEKEVKVIYPKLALTIVMKKSEILLNNRRVSESQKEVKSANDKIIARINQVSNKKTIEIPEKFTIELIDGKLISIKSSDRYMSKIKGLCGMFTTEKMGDLVDGQGCLFDKSSGRMYSAAWIASSSLDRCKSRSSSSIRRLIDETEKFQEHCPKTISEQAQIRKPRHA